nr:unnamed protein product [Callosobruchus analis]
MSAKWESWKELVNEMDNDIWGKGYKIVMNKLKPPPLVTLTDDQQVQIARLLFPRHQVTTWNRLSLKQADVPLFTKDEITTAIDKIKTKKAPGPDGIPTEVVKAIAECHPETCLAVLNQGEYKV